MLTKLLPEVNYLMSPAASSLGIKNIGQISIIVHDLERATAFYRDTLGLPLLFTAPNLAFFDCGGVRLMLGPAETPELDHPQLHPLLPCSRSPCCSTSGLWMQACKW